MTLGKTYRFKDEIDKKEFSFGEMQGVFIGYTKNQWPRFKLSGSRECCINATDENFVVVE